MSESTVAAVAAVPPHRRWDAMDGRRPRTDNNDRATAREGGAEGGRRKRGRGRRDARKRE